MEVFNDIDNSISKKKPYVVICFRRTKEGLFIHFEYSIRPASRFIYKLMSKEHFTIGRSFYKCEWKGIWSNELALMYPMH